MLKKFTMVSVGVTAGLLAIAPMASATEGHDHHDKGHHKSHGGDQDGIGNIKCDAESGDLDNDATAGDSALSTGQVAGPVASGNAGQIASCNSFLNHVASDNELNILSTL